MQVEITQRTSEPIPYDLLLLADPFIEMINKYLFSSVILLAKGNEEIIGILILEKDRDQSEIMNVAVDEQHQGKGIGTKLILYAIEFAKKDGSEKLRIGTADTSKDQLQLYQNLGFNKTDRIKNFFVDHYDEPIYENGKRAKDMIRLEMSLT